MKSYKVGEGIVVKIGLVIGLLLGALIAGLLGFAVYKTYQSARLMCADGSAGCTRPGG